MKNITIKQLRGFVTVARERSFTRAAGQMLVSQSALTIAIRDLEAELGMQLFDRTTRSVEPTAQGQSFLPVAIRLLDELARGVEDLHALADRQRGSVVVAANASFINVVLAPAIAALGAAHPGIAVRIIEDTAESIMERVLSGEADFGVTTMWRPLNNEIEGRLLLKDRLGVLCTKHHPIAERAKDPAWSDLNNYPLASLGLGAGIQAMLDHYSDVAAALPKPMYEVSSVSSLVALVESGAGIAILPGIAAYWAGSKDLVFRPVLRPALHRELSFMKRKGRSLTPAAEGLKEYMLKELMKIREGENLHLASDLVSAMSRNGIAAGGAHRLSSSAAATKTAAQIKPSKKK